MKRLLMIALIIPFSLLVHGQENTLKPYKIINGLNPLVVLELNSETLIFEDLKAQNILESIPHKDVDAMDVIKGKSATSLYGEKASDGVIHLILKNNDEAKYYFNSLKGGKSVPTLIKTDVNVDVDKKTPFSLGSQWDSENGQIKINGKDWLRFGEKNPIVRISLNSEEIELDEFSWMNNLDNDLIESIDILNFSETKSHLNPNERDQIIIKLKKTAKTKRLFRKLKSEQKE